MERKWTDAQLTAIGAKRKKILVSAAAGSGKTTTLIERIIRSVTREEDPLDISRILVVTFTRAAASDLKVKMMKAIGDALKRDPGSAHLTKQMLLLESAEICTIDSFCLNVLKNEFHSSQNDANFTLGDENELSVIKMACMDKAIESTMKSMQNSKKDVSFTEFFSVIVGPKNDRDLSEKLVKVRESLIHTPRGINVIHDFAKALESDSASGDMNAAVKAVVLREFRYLFENIKVIAEGYLSAFSTYEEIMTAYSAAIQSDVGLCAFGIKLVDSGDYNSLYNLVSKYKFKSLSSLSACNKTPLSEDFCADRSAYKKAFTDLVKAYLSWTREDLVLINQKSSGFMDILYSVMQSYDEFLNKTKKERHLLEFDDLKNSVHKLFVNSDGSPTDLAREYSSKYDIIYIDEYQDVDPIQDEIFSALASNSELFVVGDIKQSIYGFRGSDPSIFGRLRSTFPKNGTKEDTKDCTAVYMSDNFRCSRPVINTSNFICSYLFRETNNAPDTVGYTSMDDLVFSRGKSPADEKKSEFVVIAQDEDKDSSEDKGGVEVKYIASRILNMIEHETKSNGEKYHFSDFAILCDKNAQVKLVSDTLKMLKIPCDNAPAKNFFSSPEILFVRSLLSAIDNPYADVHLAATLISPVFGFTKDDLLKICTVFTAPTLYEALVFCADADVQLSAKANAVLKFFASYRGYASTMDVSEFITLIWNRLDIPAIASYASDDGRTSDMKRENLSKLYSYAIAFSSGSFRTLHSFLSFLNDVIEVNPASKLSEEKNTMSSDSVHTMTIHKSKGLEFPVCFLFGTSYLLDGKTKEDELIYEPSVGFAFNPSARDGLVTIKSPYKKAVSSRISEKQKLEKIRLLYVALTRAKDKLIITCIKNSEMTKLLRKYYAGFSLCSPQTNVKGVYPVLKARTFAEWILMSDPFIPSNEEHSNLLLVEVSENEIPKIQPLTAVSPGKASDEIPANIDKERLYQRFDHDYHSKESLIPAKIAVSNLSPGILDENTFFEVSASSIEGFKYRPWFILGTEGVSATDIGTATHLFLQFADLELCEVHGIEAEISRLESNGFILSEHARIINRKMLKNFFTSSLFKTIKSAKKVYREQRFNISLPAYIFTEDKERKDSLKDNYVLVQGVIDVIFEDEAGRLILVDYKTDRVTSEELYNDSLLCQKFKERYKDQLFYYSLAAERLFGKRPDRTVIYSLAADKEIDVSFD